MTAGEIKDQVETPNERKRTKNRGRQNTTNVYGSTETNCGVLTRQPVLEETSVDVEDDKEMSGSHGVEGNRFQLFRCAVGIYPEVHAAFQRRVPT
jgi:hypothetical protein